MSGFLVYFSSGEENAIAFAANRGEDGCRSVCRIGDEFEALRSSRPGNGCSVHNEMSIECVLLIVKMDVLQNATPTHVEGNIAGYRRATHQGVPNREMIPEFYITEFHGCRCIIEVNLHTFIGSAYRPKQAAGSDTGIEVVDLIRRDNLPLI